MEPVLAEAMFDNITAGKCGTIEPALFSAPPSCKCDITEVSLANIICVNNDTPTDPGDDFITFELNPSGNNLGTGYTVSGTNLTPMSGNYGIAKVYQTDPGTAGAGDITITITDDNDVSCIYEVILTDPGICSDAPMDVCSQIEAVMDIIYSLDLPNGLENSLISKLNNAMNSFENGNMNAATGKLNAFINQVNAQSGDNIPVEVANGLVNSIQAIITLIDEGSTDCSSGNRLAGETQESQYLAFEIFPNPAKDKVYFSILKEIELANLVIYDQSGRALINEIIGGNQSRYIIELDDRFLGGVYYVSLASNGERTIEKLVVVKD